MIAELKERAATTVRDRAVRAGKVPRRAYAHYFLEGDGLHSRIHIQNFWSTFWPQFEAPSEAEISVFGADGRSLGSIQQEIAPFGSAYLEMRDVLDRVGADELEGTVAIDLRPSLDVRAQFAELPKPLEVMVNTPFWMAYYDDAENYMYVHSIERLGGVVFGTTKPVAWTLGRATDVGERWRSWRLLELEDLSEIQIVAINHGDTPGEATVGLYTANDDRVLAEDTHAFAPRQLHRIHFNGEEIRRRAQEFGADRTRIGIDPLLTENGKPYVLMRYRNGPLSLHHG